jgi:selenocysteine lyase/cysteine desulfurase
METYFIGAHSTGHWSFEKQKVVYEGITMDTAHRYNYGTQSDAMHGAALASIEFMETLGAANVENEVKRLNSYLTERLEQTPNVSILASNRSSERGGIVSFKTPKHDFSSITGELRKNNFVVRQVPESNINCIRVSTHIYNSTKEIDLFISYLEGLVK